MAMVRTGSWIPNVFIYPSGMMYVERFLVAALHLMDPTVSLSTTSTLALPEQFPYFYAGRAFVAASGALMALPTYLAARSVSNTVGGIAAAVAITVAPISIVNSHYLTTDVPVAALAAVTLWLSLRGLAGGRRWLVAAGFAAGLAAATKYDGGLVVIVPVVVLLTSCSPRQWLRRPTLVTFGLIAIASMAAFALLTPAILVNPSQVWTDGILFQLHQYSGGHAGAEGDSGAYYLGVLGGYGGLGRSLSILTGLGLLLAAVQHRRADVAVLSFVLVYFVVISLPTVRFARNLLPLVPFLAVLAGRTVGWLADFAGRTVGWLADFARRTVGWLADFLTAHPRLLSAHLRQISSVAVGLAVVVVVATPSVSWAISFDQQLRSPDTRTIALGWIEQNIPPGTAVAEEFYTPQVPDPPYRVTYIAPLANRPLDWYRSAGIEYMVASSTEFSRSPASTYPKQAMFYCSLMAQPIALDLRPTSGQTGPRVVVVRLGAPAPATHLHITVAKSYRAGSAHTVTVTALDACGSVASGYRGKVHFTSSDSTASLPADYTFTAADAGGHAFTYKATLRTVGSQWIRATDKASATITGVQAGIVVK